jgi:DNA invertase Pin-like site-specific DNA recombinase
MTFIRAYLRASTKEQDAHRAKDALKGFAKDHKIKIAAYYVENVSGASLQRPELFRLLDDSEAGDVILLEQVDRLSRLTADDWERLKAIINGKGLKIVALDLPTSWGLVNAKADDFTGRMLTAINAMLLDMLAAVARKDYEDRRRRQTEGLEKAKRAGKLTGRAEDHERNARIEKRLREQEPWHSIMAIEQCSKDTVARIARRVREQEVTA